MRIILSFKKKLLIFLLVCFAVMFVSYIRTVSIVPHEITLLQGEEYICDFKSPFLVSIKPDKEGILKINNGDLRASGSMVSLNTPIVFKSQQNGLVNLRFKAFGLIPLRTIKVDILPNKKVVACGNTIGVKLRLNGILVIGVSDVESADGKKFTPARESGIKPGDILKDVNQVKLSTINDLVKSIDESNGSPIKLGYSRGESYNVVEVTPVKSTSDKKYHIGLWVRDSTAGIGTLTFYDPENKNFGALGHGINDIDTGTLMSIASGEIIESKILSVKKGKAGIPGELKGVFVEDRNPLGEIKVNSEQGIYGVMDEGLINKIPGKLYPVALRNQIKEGQAAVLANIDGNSVQEYAIEVQKVFKRSTNSSKGMIIKITDKRLLDTTGGIVQGMSGSPIIQDNKIIGAVTHVLVNDPTRGFGIFIENMVKNIDSDKISDTSKAG